VVRGVMHIPAVRLSPWELRELGSELEAWAAKRNLQLNDIEVDAEIRRRLRNLAIEPEIVATELQRILLAMSEAGEARQP